MTILLLIRHGINDMVGKRLAGRLPGVHLNEEGRQQAEGLAQSLVKLPLKAIYSSPLERAYETAQPLATALKLPIQTHPGLQEVDFGQWSGKENEDAKLQDLWKTIQEKPSQARFPGGESFIEAQQRIVQTLEEISSAHQEEDLLACFSHCDTLRLAIVHYLNISLDDFHRLTVSPASVSALRLGKGLPKLLCLNQLNSFDKINIKS
jgi:probable phosphomutase (TIGR03848 family)